MGFLYGMIAMNHSQYAQMDPNGWYVYMFVLGLAARCCGCIAPKILEPGDVETLLLLGELG